MSVDNDIGLDYLFTMVIRLDRHRKTDIQDNYFCA